MTRGHDVLTVDEAAAFLRVNRKTIYAAVAAGQLPGAIKVGRTIRISRAALESWMHARASSTSERNPGAT